MTIEFDLVYSYGWERIFIGLTRNFNWFIIVYGSGKNLFFFDPGEFL